MENYSIDVHIRCTWCVEMQSTKDSLIFLMCKLWLRCENVTHKMVSNITTINLRMCVLDVSVLDVPEYS